MSSFLGDPRSYLGAAAAGWSWPATVPEIAQTLLAQGVLTWLMPEGESISFPMPWDQEAEAPEPIDPEVIDEMTARLAQYSALPD